MRAHSRLGFNLRLTSDEIIQLRNEYVSDKKEMAREEAAFAAGRKIAAGDFSRVNLMPIIRWKSSRPTGLVGSNLDEDISDALRLAVDAKTPRSAVSVLCGLWGIDVSVASAILATIDPDRYTVIDVRALETLGVRKQSPTTDDYLDYLAFCHASRAAHGVTLRNLDRALWQKSKNASR
ncbi:MAG: hypothetical protein ACREEL_11530 [Stellaceae bacterium]